MIKRVGSGGPIIPWLLDKQNLNQISTYILDVARCYLWLFTLYINIKIG